MRHPHATLATLWFENTDLKIQMRKLDASDPECREWFDIEGPPTWLPSWEFRPKPLETTRWCAITPSMEISEPYSNRARCLKDYSSTRQLLRFECVDGKPVSSALEDV